MDKDLEEFYQKKIIKYQKLIFTLSKHCEEIDDKILKINGIETNSNSNEFIKYLQENNLDSMILTVLRNKEEIDILGKRIDEIERAMQEGTIK